jgi:hypothetical protein
MARAQTPEPKMQLTPRRRVTYWQAVDLIGEENAARRWARGDADQDEKLLIPVPKKKAPARKVR